MKKLIGAVAAGALLLSVAGVAFAHEGIYVKNDGNATLYTTATANSNTGYNGIGGEDPFSGFISTGNALSQSLAQSMANQFSTFVDADCGCFDNIAVNNEGHATLHTTATANSNTGYNGIGWEDLHSGAIYTGDAVSLSGSNAWANIFHTDVTSF